MSDLDRAVDRARALLTVALTPAGFVASPSTDHYRALWARDAAVACLGASRSGDPALIEGVESTLRTLSRLASAHGQVPDAYWPDRGYWDWGENGTTDATALLVVALAEHVAATGRSDIADELWSAVVRAIRWLEHQDVTGTHLVTSPAGGDWMDSSLNRSGRVFHVNVLFHWAALSAQRLARWLGAEQPVDPAPIAQSIDGLFWPRPGSDLASLHGPYPAGAIVEFPHPLAAGEHAALARADRRHYLASVSYGRFVDRCDVLAHCLAIASGLTDGDRAATVLDHLDATSCDVPFPSRTWPQPFHPDDPSGLLDAHADRLQDARWRNPPGSYHNGAVWPYIGGAHVVAAVAAGRRRRARELLEGVVAANRLGGWGFHEWIEVPSGEARGARDQVWNAGALLWAQSLVGGG